MLPTPTLIAPPTAHPTNWPATPDNAYFRAELAKFLPITGGDRQHRAGHFAVQTATSADLDGDSPMMSPIAAWTRQAVFTHALTAPVQSEAAGVTAEARI